MTPTPTPTRVIALGLLSIASTTASAETAITRSVFASGAAVVSAESPSGTLTLRAVVGQPEAAAPLSAGTLELRGGFLVPGVAAAGPCSTADFEAPFGRLEIADVIGFLQRFGAMDPAADLGAPAGQFDIADVITFLQQFGAGCP